jgi:hypothetical protein
VTWPHSFNRGGIFFTDYLFPLRLGVFAVKNPKRISSIVSLVGKAMPFLIHFFSKQNFRVVLNTSPLRQFRRHSLIIKICNDVFRVEMLNEDFNFV